MSDEVSQPAARPAGTGTEQAPENDRALTDSVNWAAMSHRELFAAIHEHNEPAKGHELAREWSDLAERLEQSSAEFENSVRASEAGWRGQAAAATREFLLDLARGGVKVAETSDGVGKRVADESDLVERTKAAMPEPRDFDFDEVLEAGFAGGGLGGLVLAMVAIKPLSEAADSAHQQAIDVMTGMEAESRHLDETTPAFGTDSFGASISPERNPGATGVVSTGVASAGGGSAAAGGGTTATVAASAGSELSGTTAAAAARQPASGIAPGQPASGSTGATEGVAAATSGAVATGTAAAGVQAPAKRDTEQRGPVDVDPSKHVDATTPTPPLTTESASAATVPPASAGANQGEAAPTTRAMSSPGGTVGITQQQVAAPQSARAGRNSGWQGTIPATKSGSSTKSERESARKDLEEARASVPSPEEYLSEGVDAAERSEKPGRDPEAERSSGVAKTAAEPGKVPEGSEMPDLGKVPEMGQVPEMGKVPGSGQVPDGEQLSGFSGGGSGMPSGGGAGAGVIPPTGDGAAAPPLKPGGSSSATPVTEPSGAPQAAATSSAAAAGGGVAGGAGMPMGAGAGGARQGGGESGDRQAPGYLKDQELFDGNERSAPQVIDEKFKKKKKNEG
ncbi:hypothetical protein [Parasphingorhabdus pacifica]